MIASSTAGANDMPAILAALQQAARAADAAETGFKRDIDKRIAELERERAFAYRRLSLMGALGAPIAPAERAAAIEARLTALFRHIEWIVESLDDLDATGQEVRKALMPVAAAIEDLGRPAEAGQAPAASPLDAFATFESWYRTRFGLDFLGIFEQRASFRPVVDF